jgi:hypothetical protein
VSGEVSVTNLERQGLLNAVNAVAKFVPRDAVAVLAKHKSGALVLRAFADDDSGAEQVVAGTKWGGGEVVLPLESLRQCLRHSSADAVAIRDAGEQIVITAAAARHTLASGEIEHRSHAPAIEGPNVTFGRGTLASLLRRVAFARESPGTKGAWATDCVRVTAARDRLELAATDTYHFATASAVAYCGDAVEALAPFGLLSRWAQGAFASDRTTLTLTAGQAVLKADDTIAWGATATGTFPPVASATLPPHAVPVPQELRAALALVGSDDVEVTLTISPASITLRTPALTSVVPIRRHRGPSVAIPLEGRRLANAAKIYASTGQPIVLHYTSAEQPVVLVAGECRAVQVPHLMRSSVRSVREVA